MGKALLERDRREVPGRPPTNDPNAPDPWIVRSISFSHGDTRRTSEERIDEGRERSDAVDESQHRRAKEQHEEEWQLRLTPPAKHRLTEGARPCSLRHNPSTRSSSTSFESFNCSDHGMQCDDITLPARVTSAAGSMPVGKSFPVALRRPHGARAFGLLARAGGFGKARGLDKVLDGLSELTDDEELAGQLQTARGELPDPPGLSVILTSYTDGSDRMAARNHAGDRESLSRLDLEELDSRLAGGAEPGHAA
jgi:hypothetical protein